MNGFVELLKLGGTVNTTFTAGEIQIHGKLGEVEYYLRFDLLEVRDNGNSIDYGMISMHHSMLKKLLEDDIKWQKKIDTLEKSGEYQGYLKSELERLKKQVKYYKNTPVMEFDGCEEYALSDELVQAKLQGTRNEIKEVEKKIINASRTTK